MTLGLCDATLDQVGGDVLVPAYDRGGLGTGVLHIGPGAFHRAHQASYIDDLAAQEPGWGIAGVSLNSDGARAALAPQDGLYTLVTRGQAAGRARIIGALRDVLVARQQRAAVERLFALPGLRLVTITATEKAYPVNAEGALDRANRVVAADLAKPHAPNGLTGWLVRGLALRRAAGLGAPAILSCDNLDRNGARLRVAVVEQARLTDPDLAAWIAGEVRFPSAMVDSITPATDDALLAEAAVRLGLVDAAPVQRETYRRWAIEEVDDPFVRRLGDVGAVLTADVAGHAEAKLRLLNAVHSTLAYCGLLRGHATVAQAMADPYLWALCRGLADDIMPGLNVPSLDLHAYAAEILARLSDPGIAHRLDQIAMDGTRKLPVRLVPSLEAALAQGRPVDRLVGGIAGWMAWVVQNARTGVALADPEAAMLTLAGRSCTGDARHDVDIFRRTCPALVGALWQDEGFVTALERAYPHMAVTA